VHDGGLDGCVVATSDRAEKHSCEIRMEDVRMQNTHDDKSIAVVPVNLNRIWEIANHALMPHWVIEVGYHRSVLQAIEGRVK
jgi:hypothetical protein